MADLAHDASGPASSEPASTALQQAGRTASSDKEKLRVFISYSRDDLKFADQLEAALNLCGFECLIDRHDISGGEDWKRRLGSLISEGLCKLGPITALAALGFHVLGCERPTATVEVALDSHPLRLEPEAATPLLIGADPEIRNEFALSH